MIRTVFFYEKKGVQKRIFKGRSYFLKLKSMIFTSKNTFAPIGFLSARLLSAAKNKKILRGVPLKEF